MGQTAYEAASKPAIYVAPQLPLAWVVSDGQSLHIVPARHNGWQDRRPYLGHRQALEEVPGYNTIGLGIPFADDIRVSE